MATRKLTIATKSRIAQEQKERINDVPFQKDLSGYLKTNESFQRAYGGKESSDYSNPLIPTETANFFYDRIYWENRLRNIVSVIPMPRASFKIPVKTAGSSVYLQGEIKSLASESGLDQASSGYSGPTISYLTLTAVKHSGISGWSTELEEDSLISIPQLMFEELAVSIGEYEELSMLQGDYANGHTLTGTITGWDNPPFTAGDVRYGYDGLIMLAPGTNANVWTPDSSDAENKFDGGLNKLI
jgi:HK97 family phage major capsid protein